MGQGSGNSGAGAVVRVKICCIGSVAEARSAIRQGASAIGLVSEMPSGPGVIPEARIAEISAVVPPSVSTFLLTSSVSFTEIVAQQRRCRVDTIQLCDRFEPGLYASLREALPGISLVQVIHVTGEGSVREAAAVAGSVDALLLDSGNSSLPVKELGGTGRTHDWALSARIVERSPVPVFLAGGLNAENVAEAIRTVRPFGVDVCSGVRTADVLDERKLTDFMDRVLAGGRRG